MLNLTTKALSMTAALAFAATGALAQTAASQPQPTTATKTIGVSPQDAKEALQKAKPQADTGTLVRTEPSAADRAKELSSDAKATVTQPLPKPAPVSRSTAPQQPAHANPQSGSHAAPEPGDSKNHTTTGTVTNTTTPNAAMGITGTLPGAAPSNANATNTRDNAEKAPGATHTDTMGNRTSSDTPAAK